jgi:iron(III) transport system permease protein
LALLPGVVLSTCLALAGLIVAVKIAPGDRPPSLRQARRFALGRWRLPAFLFFVAVIVLLAGVPIGSLCYKAGVLVTQTDAGRLRSWSPGKCMAIVAESPWRYRREFGWSLGIGSLAATAAVVVGAALAWFGRVGRFRAGVLMVLAAVLLTLPGPVLGLAVIRLLNRPEVPLLVWLYDQSILAPWLALTLRGLGPAMLILWYAFRFVPPEVLDAAAVDGAGALARLWRIVLPSKIPALAMAWLVALAVALGDLAASILVVPPAVTTLSIRIFTLLHYGVEDQVAGISLALVALSIATAAAVARLARRGLEGGQ